LETKEIKEGAKTSKGVAVPERERLVLWRRKQNKVSDG
jgi:hypothetical protein